MRTLTFFLLLITSTFLSSAQDAPLFEPFRGVPQKGATHAIYIVPETNEKWLASERGLIRVSDDSEKATFQTEFLVQTPMAALTADKRGRKWAGGYSSNLFTENETGEWVPFTFTAQGKFIIADLATDARNHVWAATLGGGLWRVNERGEGKFFTEVSSKIRSNQVYAVALDNTQTKWVGTDEGLQSFGEDGRWERYRFLKQATAITYAANTLWVAGLNERWQAVLWKKEGNSETWLQVPIPVALQKGKLTDIHYETKTESLWLTGAALGRLRGNDWDIYGTAEGFTSRSGLCLAVDEAENVWVGTEGKGLLAWIQYPPEGNKAPISAPANLAEVLERERMSPEWLNQEIRINIGFPQSQAIVLPEYFAELDRLAAILTKFPRLNIQLAGHTDNRGRAHLNQQLSYRRAESVKAYLVEKRKIRAERIQTIGYGGTRPIADNNSEDTRQRNRRVTVQFLK